MPRMYIPLALLIGLMVWAMPMTSVTAAPTGVHTGAPTDAYTGAHTGAPTDDPITIVSVGPRSWTVDSGFVYYMSNCFGVEFVSPASLGRKATSGRFATSIASMADDPNNCETYIGLEADEDALYYADWSNGRIVKRDSGNLGTEIPLATFTDANRPSDNVSAHLAVDSTHVYWIADDDTIKRVVKEGGTAETFVAIADKGRDIEIVASTLYWTDGAGFHFASTNCDSLPCTEITTPDTAESTYITPGPRNLIRGSSSIYYVTNNKILESARGDVVIARDTISAYTCSNLIVIPDFPIDPISPINPRASAEENAAACSVEDIYTASSDSSLSKVSWGDDFLFWEEYNPAFAETRIYRMPLNGGDREPIYVQQGQFVYGKTYTDNLGVYFRTRDEGIVRLPFDAAPITREFSIDNWEITQAIQNLNNDVPLVAKKPTVVRVYGSHVSGPNTNGVSARLYGERNGSALPGELFAYLTPVNGTESLRSSYTPDRANRNDGWMFELPSSWTEAGQVTLRVEIDPDDLFGAKETSTEVVNFTVEPAACLIYMPVRTHNPLPGFSDPHVGAMINRFTQLWPVPRTRTYWQSNAVEEVELCWWGPFPHPCGGPFELNEGASIGDWFPDKDEAQTYIATRAIFSDDPDICDAENSAVHYVGMVHRDAPTGGTAGYALLDFVIDLPNSSWVVNPPAGASSTAFDWPRRGSTLAQEVTHNYNRGHVACGTNDGVDNGYPYPVCQLDNVGQANHYGFDTTTNTPIEPDDASDFMSYGSDRWVSDYTYKAVKNRFGFQSNQVSAASALSAEAIALEEAASFILVTGAVDPTQERGLLAYAYQLESDTVSIGIMRKMQALAGSRWNSVNASMSTRDSLANEYHVRLLDADGNVLDDRMVELRTPDNHGEPTQARPFFLTMPVPTGTVATIELLGDDELLDSRSPGTSAPVLAITAPTGGSTVGEPVEIKWSGSDADSADILLYNISYSADNGNNWTNLATDYAGNPTITEQSLTLVENSLPGTTGATGLIRIIASDGYNSTTATSEPFIVANQAPQPFITSPTTDGSYDIHSAVPLRGFATDAEEGALESGFAWQVDGAAAGNDAISSIDGLAPGLHEAKLTVTDVAGNSQMVSTMFQIDAMTIPQGNFATLDGTCNDAAYANAVALPLEMFGDGGQATAYLLRSSSSLQVCFVGLRESTGGTGAASIRIDTEQNGGTTPQSDDYAFRVDENGTPADSSGDGAAFTNDNAPGGFAARIASDGSGLWSAELRIAADTLGGWDQQMALMLEHEDGSDGMAYQWPYAAINDNPDTWAKTNLGKVSEVLTILPESGVAGTPLDLSVMGSDFTTRTLILWDDSPVATTQVMTETQLAATVASPTFGTHKVTIIPAADAEVVGKPFFVTINNPAPTIISVAPNSAMQNQPEDIALVVKGAAFVDGAEILWDGAPLATTFVGSGELQATIPASALTIGRTMQVAVINPSPALGGSESMSFEITPANTGQPNDGKLFMPFVSPGQ